MTVLGPALESSQDGLLSVLQALSALAVVALVIWLARSGFARLYPGKRGTRMQIEERLALDVKNALVIVRVDERRLLLATHDREPARLLRELDAPSQGRAGEPANVSPASSARSAFAADGPAEDAS